jgi:hypothetical protein
MLWQPKYRHYPHFSTRASVIDRQLFAPLSIGEILVILLHLYFLILTLQIRVGGVLPPNDYNVYTGASMGNFLGYYYAYWLLPFYRLFTLLPDSWGYIVWTLIFLLGIFIAARIFGGSAPLAMLTYQMIYGVFFGQITGLLIGALALAWWALAHRRWHLAGFFFLIAATKFQLGMMFGLFLLLFADISWRDRVKVLIVPTVIALISLVVYPLWFLDIMERMRYNPVNDLGSLAPWRWIGPLALVVWIPPIVLKLPIQKRLIALVCASILGVPYFQQADLLALFVLPVGLLPLLGNFGLLYNLPQFSWSALQNLWFIPLLAYLWVILPALRVRLSR